MFLKNPLSSDFKPSFKYSLFSNTPQNRRYPRGYINMNSRYVILQSNSDPKHTNRKEEFIEFNLSKKNSQLNMTLQVRKNQ